MDTPTGVRGRNARDLSVLCNVRSTNSGLTVKPESHIRDHQRQLHPVRMGRDIRTTTAIARQVGQPLIS
jgi:hypothetical protein